MEDQMKAAGDSPAQKNIIMAAKRTMMAAERTFMSWVRTGLSLIGFGFTIYQFLLFIQQEGMHLSLSPYGPRRIGVFLIGLGLISLVIGSIQYWRISGLIAKEFGIPRFIFPLILSALIALLGVVLLVAAVINVSVI
jgi:putative membrane protein